MFGFIDEFAAAVVTLARITFGVFVGQRGALCFQHARAGVVFRRDQLDMLFLTADFLFNGGPQLAVKTGDGHVFAKHRSPPAKLNRAEPCGRIGLGDGKGRNCSVSAGCGSGHTADSCGQHAQSDCVKGPVSVPCLHCFMALLATPGYSFPFEVRSGMAQYVYTMNRVSKIVPPKREILTDISLSFFPGAKIGVLGLNGSGKSTLLRIMAGVDQEFNGEARPQPGIKIGYLSQEPPLDPTKDVRGNVEEGVAEAINALADLEKVYAAYAEPDADFDALAKKQEQLENIIRPSDAHNLEHKLEVAADALRLPPWDADVTKISGGERRRVALCRLLLSNPDMLLLDEPTNHLDAESVAWLEHFLCEFPGTVVAITHDRYFLDNAAGWILELDRGRGIPFEGNYSGWLEAREQRLEREQKQEAGSHVKSMKSELEWVRQNAKGRQAKSKARLARFEEMQSQEFQTRNETNEIYIPPGPRLGDVVIEVE